MLGAVVPGEGGRDLGRRGLTPVVAMLGEGVGVGTTRDDVAENAQAGDAGDDPHALAATERRLQSREGGHAGSPTLIARSGMAGSETIEFELR